MSDSILKNILTIQDLDREDISGIIRRMELLLDYFKKNERYHSLIPFLKTYYIITRAVAEKHRTQKDYYKDFSAMERLDVHFASLYFKPLAVYLETGTYPTPWRTYFAYCDKKGGIPYLQMLLGINAHINADLTYALAGLGYSQQEDFLIINKILNEEIPRVMKFLAFYEYDLIGLGSLVFKSFVEEKFQKTIVQWRSHAWQNTSAMKNESRESWQSEIHAQTESLGENLVNIFHDLIRLKRIPSGIHEITGLRVELL